MHETSRMGPPLNTFCICFALACNLACFSFNILLSFMREASRIEFDQ